MDYVIVITDDCNLRCRYCYSPEEEWRRGESGVNYQFEELKAFLSKDPGEIRLMLYGGEPLLDIPFLTRCINELTYDRIMLQTNGTLLHELSDECLNKIDVMSVSVDGPAGITNVSRGKGVYETAMKEIQGILDRGYKGNLHARMVIDPLLSDVYACVAHFIDDCEIEFDTVYWQLNALFWKEHWGNHSEKIIKWFREYYNPGITKLAKIYSDRLIEGIFKPNFVPFSHIVTSEMTGKRLDWVRCGAGRNYFGISTSGDVFPCAVLQSYPNHKLCSIKEGIPCREGAPDYASFGTSDNPSQQENSPFGLQLKSPCPDCDVLYLCGGRCLLANHEQEWGEEGNDLVCESVKHLIRETQKYMPDIRKAHEDGKFCLDTLVNGTDFSECIP